MGHVGIAPGNQLYISATRGKVVGEGTVQPASGIQIRDTAAMVSKKEKLVNRTTITLE